MTLPVIRQIEGNKLRRTLNSCIGNICVCLSRAIEDLLNGNASHGSGEKGLKQHWAEQIARGAEPPGTATWNRHQINIRDQQRNLRDHLREHEARGCGGPGNGSPVPADAWQWASRGLPTQQDWGAHNPAAYEGLTGSPIGDAAVVAGSVSLGYLIYRGIRMIPSIFFPPSIPANLAIP